MKIILKLFSTFFVLTAVFGCKDDSELPPVPMPDYTIYTVKGSPTLINCQAYFNSEYKQVYNYDEVRFRILMNPSFGKVSVVNYGLFIGPYFYYEPKPNLQVSKDEVQFVAEMFARGKRLSIASFHILFVPGCERGPLVTHIKIQKNNSYSLNLLDNDLFCNTDWEEAVVSDRGVIIHHGEEYKDFDYGNEFYRLDDTNSSAIFSYTPGPDFTGTVEFFYDLGVNPNPESRDDYMQVWWNNHPGVFEKYTSVKLVIEVTP